MIGRRILTLALLGSIAVFPIACGDDDDDASGQAAQNCAQIADPCARCSCQVCPCDSVCQRGVQVFAECSRSCISQDGGDLLACIDGCANQTAGSTRSYVTCTQSVATGQCASSCRP